ncbi:glycosyltransferase family 2 protein [Leucobacter luti]|uniref:glycosyltransferase family 2 protein n=1 Tax=Leucobacter luti TaxID=340320 RepID=UPI003D01ACD9
MMIAAGIVTFDPDLARLHDNVAAIVPQVDRVLVFDNSSENQDGVRSIVRSFANVTLICGTENFGIGYALNRLAEAAQREGAEWFVTLDQDSVCPPGMVDTLRATASDATVAMVTPYICDRNKSTPSAEELALLPETEIFTQPARRGAITSGALVRLSAWANVHGCDEIFFIDYVDYDLNQRLMDKGYVLIRNNRTQLLHEVGAARPTWLRVPRKDMSGTWQIERFYAFGHSPFRCYYKARNRVLFTRKHWRKLGISHEGIYQLPQQIALTILFEPDKLAKLKAFARGVRDGILLDLQPDASSAPERNNHT